jgi:hypothetical protein
MQEKVTHTGGLIQKFGRAIGTLFLKKPKAQTQEPILIKISEKEALNQIMLKIMTGISLQTYGTEWEDGLDVILWEDAIGGCGQDGALLWFLANKSNSWWYWCDKSQRPRCISLEAWKTKYKTT